MVEQAFGRLKHRWRCISKRCDAGVKNAIKILGACVTLHNLCETHHDYIQETSEEGCHNIRDEGTNDDLSTVDGACVRDILKQYLSP